jgi:predicted aspartyl protease
MLPVDYQIKADITFDRSGRPTVPLTFLHKQDNNTYRQYRIDDMLIDTGAVLTSVNKKFADVYQYPIIKHREPVLMGFNDFGRAIRSLVKRGKTDAEAKAYLSQFAGRSKDLLDSLRIDFNITDIGLVCDLRKVSYAMLYDFVIKDVIVATPSDDDVIITEVIGMNVLEKLQFGVDFDNSIIYLAKSSNNITRINPDFTCGAVSLRNI